MFGNVEGDVTLQDEITDIEGNECMLNGKSRVTEARLAEKANITGTSAHPSYTACFIIQRWFITSMIAFEIQYLHNSTDAFLNRAWK